MQWRCQWENKAMQCAVLVIYKRMDDEIFKNLFQIDDSRIGHRSDESYSSVRYGRTLKETQEKDRWCMIDFARAKIELKGPSAQPKDSFVAGRRIRWSHCLVMESSLDFDEKRQNQPIHSSRWRSRQISLFLFVSTWNADRRDCIRKIFVWKTLTYRFHREPRRIPYRTNSS